MAKLYIVARNKLLMTAYTQQKKLWEGILEELNVTEAEFKIAFEFNGTYYDDWKNAHGANKIRNPIKTYSQLNNALKKSDNLLLKDEVENEQITIHTRYTNEKDGY